jgi:hypothetical protein
MDELVLAFHNLKFFKQLIFGISQLVTKFYFFKQLVTASEFLKNKAHQNLDSRIGIEGLFFPKSLISTNFYCLALVRSILNPF